MVSLTQRPLIVVAGNRSPLSEQVLTMVLDYQADFSFSDDLELQKLNAQVVRSSMSPIAQTR